MTMERRKFLTTTGSIAALTFIGNSFQSNQTIQKESYNFNKYRGVNLIEKLDGRIRKKFNEEDFEILSEWGFNFVRVPMSYWNWTTREDWFAINEEVIKDIDEVVDYGEQYKIHINLCFHRVPGYCISWREQEPMDLFEDSPERMKKALDATIYQWRYFSQRYDNRSNEYLSFDLINEPPNIKYKLRYEEIIRSIVTEIRTVDPKRLIVIDGINVGRTPMIGLEDLDIVQSTRGYHPISLSHYKAPWITEQELESLEIPTWPLYTKTGFKWDKETLKEKFILPWAPLIDNKNNIHVGEWGCYSETPHEVMLLWARDCLSVWKEVGWGNALWNLKGPFGVLNSYRKDVKYENYKGHKLDRKFLELLKEFS
jgi:endoglucanase